MGSASRWRPASSSPSSDLPAAARPQRFVCWPDWRRPTEGASSSRVRTSPTSRPTSARSAWCSRPTRCSRTGQRCRTWSSGCSCMTSTPLSAGRGPARCSTWLVFRVTPTNTQSNFRAGSSSEWLARALAIEPKVLLLDEPLSALDAKVRSRLRDEIRRVQLEVGITTLFVTHDQEEALAIADRVGVMNAGHIEQLGPPTAIYSRPATPFVAEFVGLTNRLAGIVKGGEVEVRGTRLPLVKPDSTEGPAIALVRPEAVSVVSDGDMSPGPLTGSVISTVFLGATSRVSVDLGDVTVLAQLPTSAVGAITAGTKVRLSLRTDPVLIARDEKAATEA